MPRKYIHASVTYCRTAALWRQLAVVVIVGCCVIFLGGLDGGSNLSHTHQSRPDLAQHHCSICETVNTIQQNMWHEHVKIKFTVLHLSFNIQHRNSMHQFDVQHKYPINDSLHGGLDGG